MGGYAPPPLPGPIGGGVQIPAAAPVHGGLQNPSPPGTLPYKFPVSAQVVQGINAFVQEMLQGKLSRQEMHRKNFQDGIQRILIGDTSVDKEYLLKEAERGGMHLKASQKDAELEGYKQSQAQAQSQMLGAGQDPQTAGLPPGVASPMGAMSGGAPVGPPPAPATPPSLMNRIRQGLGFGGQPPVSMGSPAGKFLDQLQQSVGVGGGAPGEIARQGGAAKSGADLLQEMTGVRSLGAQQDRVILGLMHQALTGDINDPHRLKALDMLQHLPQSGWSPDMRDHLMSTLQDIYPDVPISTLRQRAGESSMYLMMGGPTAQLARAKAAAELAPRVQGGAGVRPGDVGAANQWLTDYFQGQPSKVQMGLTPGEAKDQSEVGLNRLKSAGTILEHNPYANFGDALPVALGQEPGAGPGLQAYGNMIVNSGKLGPSKGTQEERLQQIRNGPEWGNLSARIALENRSLDIQAWKTYQDAGNPEIEKLWQTANDQKQPVTIRQGAIDSIAGLYSHKSLPPINIGGKDYKLDPAQSFREYNPLLGGWVRGGAPGLHLDPGMPSDLSPFFDTSGIPKGMQDFQGMFQTMHDYTMKSPDARKAIRESIDPNNQFGSFWDMAETGAKMRPAIQTPQYMPTDPNSPVQNTTPGSQQQIQPPDQPQEPQQ